MLVAVAVLFSVSYWLISKVEAAKWQQFIRDKVNNALEHGGGRALDVRRVPRRVSRGRRDRAVLPGAVQRRAERRFPLTLGILAGFAALAVIFTLFYRFGVRIPLRPFFAVTSVLLYYMAFVFMGKGMRELQEGNALPITAIPGFPHVGGARAVPELAGVLAQLRCCVLFVFAVLKTFWPKRSVTLPTVMPAAVAPSPDAIAAIRAENDELRRRLLGARGGAGARAGARVVARAGARCYALARAVILHRAGVGRARVFRRPRGAYTLRASRNCRESLATPPCGRLHTLALPPSSATLEGRERARSRRVASARAARGAEPPHASPRRRRTALPPGAR